MTRTAEKDTTKEMTPHQKQELAGAEGTRPGRVFTPTVDIFETEGAITVVADMPGVKADGLRIDLRENVLTIDGEVQKQATENETLLMREYDTGAYHREFRISNLIDRAKIDASLNNGVLRLTLPKAEAAKPRTIEVRTG